MEEETWTVTLVGRAKKSDKVLSDTAQDSLVLLMKEMRLTGPIRPDWPKYGKLEKRKKLIPENAHHCHLKRGRPTYVACWQVVDKKQKLIEVYYAGTHENAPY